MTLRNNRAPLLSCVKLCASFQSNGWIQTGVTVRKRSIRVQIGIFYLVTLIFDGWHWKTIGYLFCAVSSFVHHLIAINEFKLELQSGNCQFGQNRLFFVPSELAIWQMTFKNNRTPLLYYFELCASICSHQWIQSRVTVQKRPIWVKIDDLLAVWPWNLTNDIENNRAALLGNIKLCASFHHPETAKLGFDLCDLDLWHLTLTVNLHGHHFCW